MLGKCTSMIFSPQLLLVALLALYHVPRGVMASYPTFQDTQCVGHTLNLACDSEHRIQVIHVIFGQATECVFNPRGCMKQDHNFHPCTGLQVCTVRAPPINIQGCGVSTYAHVTYNCIPVVEVHDICSDDGQQPLTSTHGYLSTPGYPRLLNLPTAWCSVRIHVPRNFRLKLYLLDSLGSSGLRSRADDCNVRLKVRESLDGRRGGDGAGEGGVHVVGGADRGGNKQQVVTCLEASYLRNELIYTSFTNRVKLDIYVDPSYNFKKKKGVLLYFEGIMGNMDDSRADVVGVGGGVGMTHVETSPMFLPTSSSAAVGRSLPVHFSHALPSPRAFLPQPTQEERLPGEYVGYGQHGNFPVVPPQTSYTIPPASVLRRYPGVTQKHTYPPTPTSTSTEATEATELPVTAATRAAVERMVVFSGQGTAAGAGDSSNATHSRLQDPGSGVSRLQDLPGLEVGVGTSGGQQGGLLVDGSSVTEEDGGSGSAGWAPIVGGILSGVAVILLILIVLVMLWERRKRKLIDSQTYMDILTASSIKPKSSSGTGHEEGGATIYEDHFPGPGSKEDPTYSLSVAPCGHESGGLYNPGFSIGSLEFDSSEDEDDQVDLDLEAKPTQKSLNDQRVAVYQAAVQKSKEKGKKKILANTSYDRVLPSIEEEESRRRNSSVGTEAHTAENTYDKSLPYGSNEELYGKVVETPPHKVPRDRKLLAEKRCNHEMMAVEYAVPPVNTLSPVHTPCHTPPPPLLMPGGRHVAADHASCASSTTSAAVAAASMSTLAMAAAKTECVTVTDNRSSDNTSGRRNTGAAASVQGLSSSSSNQDLTINIQLRMSNQNPEPAKRKKPKSSSSSSSSAATAPVPPVRPSPAIRHSRENLVVAGQQHSRSSSMESLELHSPPEKSTEAGKPAPPVAPKPRLSARCTGSPDNTIMVENEVYDGVIRTSGSQMEDHDA